MFGRCNQYSSFLKNITLLGVIIFTLSVRPISGAIYLWDGIVWVYLGDSITEAHNYNQYMEAYFHLRYPGLRLHFREAGISGATQEDALEIYEFYVYPWEPDVVSVMFGHNGDYTPHQYKEGILELCDTITKVSGSLPVLFGPQPLYETNVIPVLGYFCDSLASISRDKGWPFADEWHHLKPIWDKNLNSPVPIDIYHWDLVHPGPPGHLCMAYSLLRNLDTVRIISDTDTIQERTTDIVSSATIDASTGSLISSTKCTVSAITKTGKGIRFIRKDERLPMPFDEAYGVKARIAIDLMPEILDSLNRYMLKITGLPAYSYDINIDGVKSATVTSSRLAMGWNMASMTQGPIYDQLMNVLNKIRDKEGLTHDNLLETSPLKGNTRFRSDAMGYYFYSKESRERLKKHLIQPGAAMSEVVGLDNAIHNAAQPAPHVFEIYETENQKPTVAVSDSQTVFFPDSASLIGGVNDDGLPNPPGKVTTTWEKVAGPGFVYFSSPSTQITKAVFSDTGTYVVRFIGHDSELSDTDEVTIHVKERVVTNITNTELKLPSELSFSAGYTGNNAVFSIGLPQAGKIDIEIYNIQGKLLWNYTSTLTHPGKYRVKWNPGNRVHSGIWFIKLMTETKHIVKKVKLLR